MRNLARNLTVVVVSMLIPLMGQYAVAGGRGGNRGGGMQPPMQMQQQGPQNDEAIKAADDAKAAADAAKQDVIDANKAILDAQKEVDAATKALKKVEDDTIDAQPDDSAVGKARDAYRAADKKYQEARASVLQDPDFKERLAAAKEADDDGASLLALRKEFEDMPVIADSRAAKQAAKDAFEPLKTNLLSETPQWVAKNDDLKTKKTALDDAKHKYAEKLVASGKAKTAATKAIAAARVAQMRGGSRSMGRGPSGSAASPTAPPAGPGQ